MVLLRSIIGRKSSISTFKKKYRWLRKNYKHSNQLKSYSLSSRLKFKMSSLGAIFVKISFFNSPMVTSKSKAAIAFAKVKG